MVVSTRVCSWVKEKGEEEEEAARKACLVWDPDVALLDQVVGGRPEGLEADQLSGHLLCVEAGDREGSTSHPNRFQVLPRQQGYACCSRGIAAGRQHPKRLV